MASRTVRSLSGYLAMLVAAAIALWFVHRAGVGLTAPAPEPGSEIFGEKAAKAGTHAFFHVLLALIVILLASRALGLVFSRIGQPPVIGEMFAGIMLGPSLLGRVAPEAYAFLLPEAVAPQLSIIAQI